IGHFIEFTDYKILFVVYPPDKLSLINPNGSATSSDGSSTSSGRSITSSYAEIASAHDCTQLPFIFIASVYGKVISAYGELVSAHGEALSPYAAKYRRTGR